MSGAFSAALLMGAFYRPVVVLGHSMEPTLRDR
jgi:signal peptidase I